MNYFKKSYEKMMNWAFDEESDSKVDEYDDCKICYAKCTNECDCRCHITSCSNCDKFLCDYKKCSCKCHGESIQREKVEETRNEAPPQFAQYSPIEPASSLPLSKSPSNQTEINQQTPPEKLNKKEKKKNTSFVNKLKIRYTDLKNEAERRRELKNQNISVSNRSNSPLIKFKSRRKPLQDLIKVNNNNLNKNKSVEKNQNNSTNTPRSFNVNENIFVANEIKRAIENKKFKELSNSVSKSKIIMKTQNSISSPIAPSQREKSYLNHSFDLNNSELYHGKSSIVKKMEDLQRNIIETKKRDKDHQAKSIKIGFESQEAWQMYNSLIFANPLELPDPDLLIGDEDFQEVPSNKKSKHITASFSKKS
jgi:hypothetical protein